jgi:nicotinate-nucleotide adenylyltransferase
MGDPAPVVGLLGGSFDPVHLGHLALAETARRRLGLERMLMLLTATPPHKPQGSLAPVEHRLAMLRLALRGQPGLELCELDLTGERVRFTIETLRALRDARPACRPVFVLGMDSLLEIESWKEHQRLLEEFDLAVMDRPGRRLGELRGRLPEAAAQRLTSLAGARPAPGAGGRVFHLPVEPVPVSSTEIRSRVAAGLPVERLVPPGVAEYIRVFGLYREEGGRSLSKEIPPEIVHAVAAAQDKKASDVLVLDLRGLSDVTDHFLICSGTSDRQVLAIADNIQERLQRELGRKPKHVEGLRTADWILLDYVDLVVHVFLEERRQFYRLERLWGDARRIEVGSDDRSDEPRSGSSHAG